MALGPDDLMSHDVQMAKRRRDPSRYDGPPTEPRPSGLEIAIVTAPSLSSGIASLHEDARLVKSALLYADHVDLISHSALLIAQFQAALEAGNGPFLEFLGAHSDDVIRSLGLDPAITRTYASESLHQILSNQNRRSTRGRQQRERKFRSKLRDLFTALDENGGANDDYRLAELAARAGAAELEEALEDGILAYSPRGEYFSGDLASHDDYVPTLIDFLGDHRSHLMFDSTMSAHVRRLTSDGRVTAHPEAIRHSREVGVGTDMIRHLPVFPDAPLHDLLEARRQLSEPLQDYRAAVEELAEQLNYGPFDVENEQELDELWQRTVSRQIRDLKLALRGTKVFKDAATDAIANASTPIAGLGVAAITMSTGALGGIVEVASGLLTAGITAVANGYRSASVTREDASKNQMYYLCQLDRKV